MLFAFSSPGIYTKYVQLPHEDEAVHSLIRDNPKYYPFFQDAIGAIDGTHIACTPAAAERDATRNRKGFTSQNCLVCCNFDMQFTYVLSGWEGSMADASVYHDARTTDFTIPDGKYYLADAGYPNCPQLLVPYHGQRYHLAEWGRTGTVRLLFLLTHWHNDYSLLGLQMPKNATTSTMPSSVTSLNVSLVCSSATSVSLSCLLSMGWTFKPASPPLSVVSTILSISGTQSN